MCELPVGPDPTEGSRPVAGVQVKICGITNLEDARAAARAGADLLGFIFYPPSPRFVEPETAAQILQELRRTEARLPRFVGVFVNAEAEQVAAVMDRCRLDLAQLHGDEPPAVLAALGGRAFKALRPATQEAADREGDRFGPLGCATGPQLLVDGYRPGVYGGTGQTADWAGIRPVAHRYRLLLAGGLSPENVQEAIRAVRPWGVDVSSGVEAEPGRKDHRAVRAFVAAAKENHG